MKIIIIAIALTLVISTVVQAQDNSQSDSESPIQRQIRRFLNEEEALLPLMMGIPREELRESAKRQIESTQEMTVHLLKLADLKYLRLQRMLEGKLTPQDQQEMLYEEQKRLDQQVLEGKLDPEARKTEEKTYREMLKGKLPMGERQEIEKAKQIYQQQAEQIVQEALDMENQLITDLKTKNSK
jgi:hypothetical protein